MKRVPKRFLAYHYNRVSKSFHIVAKIRDEPGSLSRVLESLKSQVNLTVTVCYNLGDGSSVLTAFAEPTSSKTTVESIRKALTPGAAEEAGVFESQAGLLADTFHSGIDVGGGREFMLIPQDGLARTYSQVAGLFGSGGETILYNQGAYFGETNMKRFVRLMGKKELSSRLDYATNLYGALGWGNARLAARSGDSSFTYVIEDCFECVNGDDRRKSCTFMRGHIEGSLVGLFGGKFSSTETKCRFRGDHVCEFEATRAAD